MREGYNNNNNNIREGVERRGKNRNWKNEPRREWAGTREREDGRVTAERK
jgi:hypothetical protein